MTPKERAEAHWDHYVGPMQRVMLVQMVEMCMEVGRFHYVSSHVHGVKHEQQDAMAAVDPAARLEEVMTRAFDRIN